MTVKMLLPGFVIRFIWGSMLKNRRMDSFSKIIALWTGDFLFRRVTRGSNMALNTLDRRKRPRMKAEMATNLSKMERFVATFLWKRVEKLYRTVWHEFCIYV